jgi:hypothetical protein
MCGYAISDIRNFKDIRINRNSDIFETHAEFFFAAMKANWRKVEEEYC